MRGVALLLLSIAACAPAARSTCNDDDDCDDGAVCLGGICTAGDGEGEGDAGEGEGEGEGAEGEGDGDVRLVVPALPLLRAGAGTVFTVGFVGDRDRVVVDGALVGGDVAFDGDVGVVTAFAAGSSVLTVRASRDGVVVDEVSVDVLARPADWHVLDVDRRVVVDVVAPGAAAGSAPVRVEADSDDDLVFFDGAADAAPLRAVRDGKVWWVRPTTFSSGARFYGYAAHVDGGGVDGGGDPFFDYDAVFHFDDDLGAFDGPPLPGADLRTAVFDSGVVGRALRTGNVAGGQNAAGPAILAAPAPFLEDAGEVSVSLVADVAHLPPSGSTFDLFTCSIAALEATGVSRLALQINANRLRLAVRGDDDAGVFANIDGGLVHAGLVTLGVTVGGDGVDLYVDDEVVHADRVDGLPFDAGPSFRCTVGGDEGLALKIFDGAVDELRITRAVRQALARELLATQTSFTAIGAEVAPP